MNFVFFKDTFDKLIKLRIPQPLIDNSPWLKEIYTKGHVSNLAPQSNESDIHINHICSLEECKEIIQAIENEINVTHQHFVACVRFCHELAVDEKLLQRLLPLHHVSCTNMPHLCPVLFSLWRSRYRELTQEIYSRCLQTKLNQEQTSTYSTFKTTIRNLCAMKIRHSRQIYTTLKSFQTRKQ